jgi:hypothetical protein
MSNLEIDTRKVKAYDLLRQININMARAKQLQGQLQKVEQEIAQLEQEAQAQDQAPAGDVA